MQNKLKNAIAVSIIPQIVLVKWFGSYPEIVETYYSHGIYPYWSGFFRALFGWVPWSVGDILYGSLIILLAYFLWKKRNEMFHDWKSLIRDFIMVLAVAYFSFHISWGMNYYRQPIAKAMDLNEDYNTDELINISRILIEQTNALQFDISGDTSSMVQIPYSQREIFDKTIEGYGDLADQFPFLRYQRPSLKKSLLSIPLTYMGYGGYLNPFTHESQVNSKIPNFRFPVVCGHEVGHQLGYSAENEVNFIGYLVMANHSDKFLRYSAYAYALSHVLREVNKREPETYKELYHTIHAGVRKNYEELKRFWQAYDSPLEPVFKNIFNSFLKANNQKEGIKSYNLVVSLIIGYHEKYPFSSTD